MLRKQKLLSTFLIALILLSISGCIKEFKEGYEEGLNGEDEEEGSPISPPSTDYSSTGAEGLQDYVDEKNGYSIKIPKGWSIGIENNKYLSISSPDKSLGAIVWPVVLEGKYKAMTILDLTNYLIGNILKQYPDFKKEKIYKGPKENSIEIIGTFTVNSIPKKISLFAYLENGYGIVSGYEAPQASFKEKEPMLRTILASYQNTQSPITQEQPKPSGLSLTEWTDGTISVQVPVGWQTTSGGNCETKYFISKDPNKPINQVFYFSEVGPIYLNEEKKQFDQQYVAMGGYNLFWLDAPVIQPLTPENFLKEGLKGVSQMGLTKQLGITVPQFENVEVTSEESSNQALGYSGQQKVMTANFEENGIKGKGQFFVVTTEFTQMGLGYGMMVVGVTSTPEEFDNKRESLIKSLESFTMDQGYINRCIAAQNQATAGILKAGKTLSETSDIIMDAYEYRQQTMDKINEQWDDVIRGRERLYDQGTDTVYSVPTGFKDYYDTNRDQFEMNNLQELPQDKWGDVPLDGEAYIG